MVAIGCAGPVASSDSEPGHPEATELAAAPIVEPIDPRQVAGTYDVSADAPGAAPDLARLVLLQNGTALACPTRDSATCTPRNPPSVTESAHARPFELSRSKKDNGLVLLIRTSDADPTPFRTYALEGDLGSDPKGVGARKLEAGVPGARVVLHRLPCSETMYDESSADNACAFYQCKLDSASSAADRCSYYGDFGLPYCRRFFATPFDNADFGRRTRQCLQEALRDLPETLSCASVQDRAIRSHVDCYVDSGFCTLGPIDQARVLATIEVKDWNVTNALTLGSIEESCMTRR
jgi:hypothetical protein